MEQDQETEQLVEEDDQEAEEEVRPVEPPISSLNGSEGEYRKAIGTSFSAASVLDLISPEKPFN